jgi:hypothetical protein
MCLCRGALLAFEVGIDHGEVDIPVHGILGHGLDGVDVAVVVLDVLAVRASGVVDQLSGAGLTEGDQVMCLCRRAIQLRTVWIKADALPVAS